MSEAKHTPGPWVVYDDSNDGKTGRIEIAATGKTVARIYNSVPSQDLPNASLIAAAPELLEALEAISTMYAHTWDKADGGLAMFSDSVERFEVAHEKARAAIAKATGAA